MIKTRAAVETSEVVEQFIRTMIKLSEDPTQVMVGIYNAFVHGDILNDIGWGGAGKAEQYLNVFFDQIDNASKSLELIKALNE